APDQIMSGRQSFDLPDHGLRSRNEAQQQISGERVRIDLPRRKVLIEERRQFRTEIQSLPGVEVIKWLLAQPVSRQEKRLLAGIPKRKTEHPAQEAEHVDAVLLVEMDKRFGITVCFEPVPAFFQACAQLQIIINRTVEDDMDRFVFVRNWLVAAGQVNDAEPPNRQTNAWLHEIAFVIRPAVPQRLRHLLKERPTIRPVLRSDVTSNPAHEVPFSPERSRR